LAAGDPLGAASLASEALASGDPRVQDDGARILQQGNLPPADAGKVGVLLPLDGRYAAVAAQIRDALVDGWSQVARPEQLVFMATDGTQASALAGFDALVLEQHVIGVIGPLRPDETPGVVDRAQELGVPLLSLSQSLDDASPWPWVFQAWVTPRAQVRALLDVVMDDRHARDFAIYAPQSAYGTLAATVFTEEVAARGGAVVARVDYPEDTKTHATYVAKLRQPDPDPTHPEPWYDAIFVPDSGARVILGAAAMAGQEISVGAFRAQRREPAPLLGLSAWTRYDLVTSGGAPLQHGLFTDVYIAPPTTAGLTWSPLDAWPAFTDRFQASYGRAPSNLEAMASDVARVVATALRAGPTDRVALREQLLATRAPGTVTGVRGFDPATRLLQRDITVFSVEAAGLQPVPHLDAP
jgi:ABC-type branched-subunit amino acid transport system substrate-binding protein